jgi:hypothetical protein
MAAKICFAQTLSLLAAKTCDCPWGVLRSTSTAVSMYEDSEALGVGGWVWVVGLFLVVGLVGEVDRIGRAANHNAHQSNAFVSQLLALDRHNGNAREGD